MCTVHEKETSEKSNQQCIPQTGTCYALLPLINYPDSTFRMGKNKTIVELNPHDSGFKESFDTKFKKHQ